MTKSTTAPSVMRGRVIKIKRRVETPPPVAENVSCGWGCKYSGTIAQVAKHIKDTHPVTPPAAAIEFSLRRNLEALARPVKARRA